MTITSRFCQQALKLGPPVSRAVRVQRDLRVPMPDGAVLLADDLEVIGEVTVELFVRSSREHTDFFARLCDVAESGASINICDALPRLAPVQPPAEPDAEPGAEPGAAIRISFPLWPTAHRFRRGHRLRLQVSSGAHPRYSRNPGTGAPLATATALLTADQQIYHDSDRPSAVILPTAAPG
jgi:putative CocE/NonD family hydrolase